MTFSTFLRHSTVVLGLFLTIIAPCYAQITSTFTDTRDGKTYRTVKIGNLTWMAENLYYVDNGWQCHHCEEDPCSWGTCSRCYRSSADSCAKYGRLYNWNAAMAACPPGWSVPTREEWGDLVVAVGGRIAADSTGLGGKWENAGVKLKSKTEWDGTDDFGFSALPGGYRHANGDFGSVGSYGYWWTVVEGGNGAYIRGMGSGVENVGEGTNGKTNGNSVRCLQDMRQ